MPRCGRERDFNFSPPAPTRPRSKAGCAAPHNWQISRTPILSRQKHSGQHRLLDTQSARQATPVGSFHRAAASAIEKHGLEVRPAQASRQGGHSATLAEDPPGWCRPLQQALALNSRRCRHWRGGIPTRVAELVPQNGRRVWPCQRSLPQYDLGADGEGRRLQPSFRSKFFGLDKPGPEACC